MKILSTGNPAQFDQEKIVWKKNFAKIFIKSNTYNKSVNT